METRVGAVAAALLVFFLYKLAAEGLVAVELVEDASGEGPRDEEQAEEDGGERFGNII
ncbi:MAG TPA: hypothetical protein VJ063_08110 [Verrucomicrobiae bacterium]|nr:hypothetical protein [Verrucomicrobiae bacterium]